MLILSVVVFAAFDFIDHTSMLTVRTETQARAADDAQRALRTVTQELRGASPIGAPCTATTDTASPSLPAGYANCVQFTVVRTKNALDTCTRTIHVFALVPNGATSRLVENRTSYAGTGTPNSATCPATTVASRRVVLDNLVNTEPLFTWLRGDGSAISTTSATAATDVPKASSVRVALHVRHRSNAPALRFTGVAALRNNTTR